MDFEGDSLMSYARPLTTRARLVIAALSVGLWATLVAATDRMVTGFPELPKDARAVAERSLACGHFAGEITGGDSLQRDQQVNLQMKKLQCDRVDSDLARVRARYRHDPKLLEILQEASLD